LAPVAIVTGAASGMGSLAARQLLESGWRVAAVDLPGATYASLADHAGFHRFDCDVSEADQVAATAAAITERLGRVDRLVNAAGIAVAGPIEQVPAARFAAVMSVNYLGTVHWVKAVLPAMRARDSGEIVLFASLAGWFATPNMGAYTATKFAVVGLAETLRLELRGTGVTLRCVCPPGVQTPMLDDILRQDAPKGALKVLKPITAQQVMDAIDASLARPRAGMYVFPGRGSTTVWRLRRFTPGLFDAALRRLL
jgi:NAD(P)-dependent dehydrogenase (short-subunit alcohol dehydrogenase family)